MSNASEIYEMLIAGGLSRAGALGVLGNFMAESSLKSNIVQRGCTTLSDDEYTWKADRGLIDFDAPIGYGLAQWTYPQRKANLLAYAKKCGVSVGDRDMQVRFCLKELKEEYPKLYKQLCESTSINGCADAVCVQYEKPAVNNYQARRNYAHQFAEEIPDVSYKPPIKDPVSATFPPDPTVLAFQLWLNYNEYPVECNGYKSEAFFKTLDQFVADMKKC